MIGETAIVGDFSLIYQGVTLGGTGKEMGKRHPTVGENVVIGAGAKVLGNILLGNNVRVGAGSVVLRDVPSTLHDCGCSWTHCVYREGAKVDPLDHARLPDSEAQAIRYLMDRIESLEQEVQQLRKSSILDSRLQDEASDCCHLKDKVIEQFLDGTSVPENV